MLNWGAKAKPQGEAIFKTVLEDGRQALLENEAKQLFISFGSRCEDKKWLSELVYNLMQEDDYGVRDVLVDCAGKFLPQSAISNFQSFKTVLFLTVKPLYNLEKIGHTSAVILIEKTIRFCVTVVISKS